MESDRSDDMFKKRWNVAVSRARDQLWVVHSFDWEHELKGWRHPQEVFRSHRSSARRKGEETEGENNADPNSLYFEAPVAGELMVRGYRLISSSGSAATNWTW